MILVWASALSFFHEVGPQDITRLALDRVDRRRRVAPHRPLAGPDGGQGRVPRSLLLGQGARNVVPRCCLPSSCSVPVACSARRTSHRGSGRTAAICGCSVRSPAGLGFLRSSCWWVASRKGSSRAPERSPRRRSASARLRLPLAATMFGHLVAAALGFAAFVAAWSGIGATTRRDLRFAAAGLCAGLAVLAEYQTVFIAGAVLVYVAVRTLRGAAFFVAAAVPSALALAAYNAAAFDSPFHLSYRYVASNFASDQAKGFFGIGVPGPRTARAGPLRLGRASPALADPRPVRRRPCPPLAEGRARGGRALRCRHARLPRLEHGLLRHSRWRVARGLRFFVPALPFLGSRPSVLVRKMAAAHARGRGALRRR